jgi:similar to spore coat protein
LGNRKLVSGSGSFVVPSPGSKLETGREWESVELAAHEIMELHELLNMKTTGIAKLKAVDGMVTDKELKAFVQQNLGQCLQDLDELQRFVVQARVQPVVKKVSEAASTEPETLRENMDWLDKISVAADLNRIDEATDTTPKQ